MVLDSIGKFLWIKYKKFKRHTQMWVIKFRPIRFTLIWVHCYLLSAKLQQLSHFYQKSKKEIQQKNEPMVTTLPGSYQQVILKLAWPPYLSYPNIKNLPASHLVVSFYDIEHAVWPHSVSRALGLAWHVLASGRQLISLLSLVPYFHDVP